MRQRWSMAVALVLAFAGAALATNITSLSTGIWANATAVHGWSATSDATAAADTGFSRVSAARAALGNGTALDTSGQLDLTTLAASSAVTIGGYNPVVTIAGITSSISVANTNVETTIYTRSIAGGLLSTGNQLRWSMRGHLSTATALQGSFTVKVKYGSATFVVVNGQALQSAASNALVALDVILTATGATNSQKIFTIYNDNAGATSSLSSFALYSTAAVDSTVAQTLAETWTFSAVNAANVFVLDTCFVELLR